MGGGLLAALRGNNKAGLKSAKERLAVKKQEEDQGLKAPAAGGGDDIMGQLARRLSLRRKGISGDKGEEERKKASLSKRKSSTGNSMMDVIADMIPEARSENKDIGEEDDW